MKKVAKKGMLMSALLLSVSVFLQACGSQSAAGTGDTIKVVVAGPMTGKAAQWGESMKNGVNLAVKEINDSGGILGKKVEVQIEDDKGDPKEAVNVAQRISTSNDVAGVIGHFTSGATMAASPIYQKAGIPEIAVASTHPKATEAGDYIFRVNVTNTGQGSGIIDWVVEKQGKRNIAILYDNDDYGNGIAEIAKKRTEEIRAKVVYEGSINTTGQQDFYVMLETAKKASPDALVIFSLYAPAAQIVSQADKVGLDVLTVGSDAIFTPDFINIAGQSSEGVYAATWFHSDSQNEGTKKFIETYKQVYKQDSDSWSPYAYDAMMIFAEAIKQAGKVDREAIRDALLKTNNFQGATGATTFTEERVPDPSSKELLFTVVKDGKFQLVK